MSAGRLLSFSAPGQTESFTYDSYGQIASLSYAGPGSPIANYQYDAAGEKLADTLNGYPSATWSISRE